ncbi:DUF2807 domain-containing protein [Sphingomonas sp. TF3]|uniref:GIN domain-containing protein n=1 Tax=Sphingomonas sp. TF3 TaxID=2495580 RepID=UPI000F87AF5F|nr:DUF2807 domain-containing protein [Sphingomonas sp. TF3]RUN75825.1 DUF2807 domain-containing protein [Sphingomonas sp. TF3]
MNRLALVLPLLAVAAPLEAADRTAFVTQFDRVRVDGPFEVHLATRAGPGARITGAPDAVDVHVEAGTLIVRAGPRSAAGGGAVVYLRTTDLRGATVIGGGKLDITGPLRAQRVDVQLTGGGTIVAPAIEAEQVNVTLIGAGTLTLGGRGAQVRIISSGAGAIDATALHADQIVIRNGGAGPITASARYFADVVTTGLGAVTVLGSPKCKAKAAGGAISCGGAAVAQ